MVHRTSGSPTASSPAGTKPPFPPLPLAIQVPLGISVALLLLSYGKRAVWGLMLVALPLVVPWNMIPMFWLGLIDAKTASSGRGWRQWI